MIEVGKKVKYVGPDFVTYQTGKYYLVTSYDEELDMYGVQSEIEGESYMLPAEVLRDK